MKKIMILMCGILIGCGGGQSNADHSSLTQYPIQTLVPNVSIDKAHVYSFLEKSTFGPTKNDIDGFTEYQKWINHQFNLPPSYLLPRAKLKIDTFIATNPNQFISPDYFWDTFYYHAKYAPDQLRQRVAFGLSEIFVISLKDTQVVDHIDGATYYYDQLVKNSFGNFRDLLEDITYSPMMGMYLTYLKNEKANTKGRAPDENFAREIMQLFTIGLNELNLDGSLKINNGQLIETYTNADITGLAKVFTGLSYGGVDTSDNRFYNYGEGLDQNRYIMRMQMYPQFHSLEEKKFLNTVIPAGTAGYQSIKIALDTLFNHPNVGIFFGKKLIQRLVKSNPSPQYIERVAKKFNDNGNAVRGDMKAVIAAVLLDEEALRQIHSLDVYSGKLKEPILRSTHILRNFGQTSIDDDYSNGYTDDALTEMSQTPLFSNSVFNYFSPFYTIGDLTAQNMVGPELNIISESSVVGLNNSIEVMLWGGWGKNWPRKVQFNYQPLLDIAGSSENLFQYMNQYFAGNKLTDRIEIINILNSIEIPKQNNNLINEAKMKRVQLAFYILFNHPDYLLEK